jgi:hypothetical protein
MKFQRLVSSAVIGAVGSFAMLAAGGAQAGVLFSHGVNPAAIAAGDGGPYSNLGNQLFANSFSLAGGGAINQVSWFGGAFNGLAYSTFNVAFYADSAGLPGAQLATTTANPTITVAGPNDGYGQPLSQFVMSIPTFNAAAGVTYWFSVSDNGPDNFVWTPSFGYFNAAWSTTGPGGAWKANTETYRNSEAFSLLNTGGAVPEPATWALMLVGFGGMGVAVRGARRRQASMAAA